MEYVNSQRCPLSLGSRRRDTRRGVRSSTSWMTIFIASASTDICRAAAASAALVAADTVTVGSDEVSELRDAKAANARVPVFCCKAAISGLGKLFNFSIYFFT